MLNKFLGTDDVAIRDGVEQLRATAAPLAASALVKRGESQSMEFKSTLRVNLHTGQNNSRIEREVLKSLAAFMNTDGGTLVIGVNDAGRPLGVEADKFLNEDKINLHLVNLVRDRIGSLHMRFIHPYFEDYQGARVLVVDCKKNLAPVVR